MTTTLNNDAPTESTLVRARLADVHLDKMPADLRNEVMNPQVVTDEVVALVRSGDWGRALNLLRQKGMSKLAMQLDMFTPYGLE